MATDDRSPDIQLSEIGDTSSPAVRTDLDSIVGTSLYPTAPLELENSSSSPSGVHQPDRILLEAHHSRDDGVSGVSFCSNFCEVDDGRLTSRLKTHSGCSGGRLPFSLQPMPCIGTIDAIDLDVSRLLRHSSCLGYTVSRSPRRWSSYSKQ